MSWFSKKHNDPVPLKPNCQHPVQLVNQYLNFIWSNDKTIENLKKIASDKIEFQFIKHNNTVIGNAGVDNFWYAVLGGHSKWTDLSDDFKVLDYKVERLNFDEYQIHITTHQAIINPADPKQLWKLVQQSRFIQLNIERENGHYKIRNLLEKITEQHFIKLLLNKGDSNTCCV